MPATHDSEREPLLTHTDHTIIKFNLTADTLEKLVEFKDKDLLEDLGGVRGICYQLRVDPTTGLLPNEGVCQSTDIPFASRKQTFGENILPRSPSKTFLQLLWCAFDDKTLFMLTAAALISLVIGVWKDYTQDENEPKLGWVEGTAILVAVIVVVLTNAINDYQRESQFKKLDRKHQQHQYIKVLRGGRLQRLNTQQLYVGDICDLEPGDVLSFDGLYLGGHNLTFDESACTGESKMIKKQNEMACSSLFSAGTTGNGGCNDDCFILSGSKVLQGVGRVLVVAVGSHSFLGKTLALTMNTNSDHCHHRQSLTPLQQKLHQLADQIAWFGIISALTIFTVLVVKFFGMSWWHTGAFPDSTTVAFFLISTVIEAITIIVVAVPEGLPMAVTLALAYAMTHLLKENNLVRILAACETMGSVTTICSDKTGTLTSNKMTVVQATLGNTASKFDSSDIPGHLGQHLLCSVSKQMRQLIKEGISVNSTAYLNMDDEGIWRYSGSQTEGALLELVDQWQDISSVDEWRHDTILRRMYPFCSHHKSMTSIIQLTANSARISTSSPSTSVISKECVTYRVHTKGAPEVVFDFCTHYLGENGQIYALDRAIWEKVNKQYARQALRTIALAYRDINQEDCDDIDSKMTAAARGVPPPLHGMVLVAIVGIQDAIRPGVVASVASFRRAGVSVRMITGDNLHTAKAVALKTGILTVDGVVLTGSEFRGMSEKQQIEAVSNLQVLARSTPCDKMIVVAKLQQLGHVVAMTGDGTNDGPALKLSDIGFSMNLAGSEVAKQASDIILLDDNFNSILKALLWGRAVNDGIRKFLTFQLTVNVAAVILALISAIISDQSESVLGAVQLLWINMIMDTLAALALATESPSDALLDRQPVSKMAPAIDGFMAYRILSQALFQVSVTLVVIYSSPFWFDLDTQQRHDYMLWRTIVFNTFVFMQFFNAINCRRIHGTLNVFEHIQRDWLFIAMLLVILTGQVMIVTFGGEAFKTVRLSLYQWLVTVAIGFCSLLVGYLFSGLARSSLLQRSGYHIWKTLFPSSHDGW